MGLIGVLVAVGHGVLQFFLVITLSPILGFVSGKLTHLWLQCIVGDPVSEIMVTLSSAYLIFYIGKT